MAIEGPGQPVAAGPDAGGTAPGAPTRVSPAWIVIFAVLAVGSGVSVSYGLAKDDPLWLVLGAAVFAPLVVTAAHASARLESAPRTAALGSVCGLTLVAVVAIVVSTPWWDETDRSGGTFRLAADDPTAHVYLHDEPGGSELNGTKGAPGPLVSGRAYQFSCVVELGDSTRWLELEHSGYWIPATAVLPVGKTTADQLHRC
jgi:hypothetical protein